MFDCYKKVDDLLKDGYVFSEKLTETAFGVLNKFNFDPEKGYNETIKFIKESGLARSTDLIEVGYSEILDNNDNVQGHSFGVLVKAEDTPRKILYSESDIINSKVAEQHIIRLLQEREELLDKLEKLTIFINTNKLFNELDNEKALLIKLQYQPMLSYLHILDKRILLEDIRVRSPKINLELN